MTGKGKWEKEVNIHTRGLREALSINSFQLHFTSGSKEGIPFSPKAKF